MNLTKLKDRELLLQTKRLVQHERQVLTKILHHLREVERRKLFSDLGCQSLFEYAVKELQYSEGQAGRRIQAMRLIKELPQVEQKIASGSLSLSNVSQAQSFFRASNKERPNVPLHNKQKLEVLQKLEHKSAREGQRVLLQMHPQIALPQEKQRPITETHTELRLVVDTKTKNQLEELRSLLGAKGAKMSLADLIAYMSCEFVEALKIKKFGKKRHNKTEIATVQNSMRQRTTKATPTLELLRNKNPRYISKETQHLVWTRDQGECCKCGGKRNLNIDHILPVSLGGTAHPQNLRLLCFYCNQRQAIKTFGIDYVSKRQNVKNKLLIF